VYILIHIKYFEATSKVKVFHHDWCFGYTIVVICSRKLGKTFSDTYIYNDLCVYQPNQKSDSALKKAYGPTSSTSSPIIKFFLILTLMSQQQSCTKHGGLHHHSLQSGEEGYELDFLVWQRLMLKLCYWTLLSHMMLYSLSIKCISHLQRWLMWS
jgi:hypothetical protein